MFIYFFFVSDEEASQRFTGYRAYSAVSNHLHAAFQHRAVNTSMNLPHYLLKGLDFL